MNRTELIRGFLENKIIDINMGKPFVLASGLTAPVYIDHRRLFSVPGLRTGLAKAWSEYLKAEFPTVDFTKVSFAGTATAGIVPAYALAETLGSAFLYVRARPKDHGRGRTVEGTWDPAVPVIVVDDMVTTGGSLVRAVDTLMDAGGKVICATSITSHNLSSTNSQFAQRQVPLKSFFTSAEIFDTAYRNQMISEQELRAVNEWMARNSDNF